MDLWSSQPPYAMWFKRGKFLRMTPLRQIYLPDRDDPSTKLWWIIKNRKYIIIFDAIVSLDKLLQGRVRWWNFQIFDVVMSFEQKRMHVQDMNNGVPASSKNKVT